MARFSKQKFHRLAKGLIATLGLAGAAATAAASAPTLTAPLPERIKLEARVAQARQVLRAATQAQAGAEVGTLLAQANNWNNWPNWSNWANWANG